MNRIRKICVLCMVGVAGLALARVVWSYTPEYCIGMGIDPYSEIELTKDTCFIEKQVPVVICGGECSAEQIEYDGGCDEYNQEPTSEECRVLPEWVQTPLFLGVCNDNDQCKCEIAAFGSREIILHGYSAKFCPDGYPSGTPWGFPWDD
jgi:hypothetical protein